MEGPVPAIRGGKGKGEAKVGKVDRSPIWEEEPNPAFRPFPGSSFTWTSFPTLAAARFARVSSKACARARAGKDTDRT